MTRIRRARSRWIFGAVASALVLATASVGVWVAPTVRPAVSAWLDPSRWALRNVLSAPGRYELRQVYAARGYRPIWVAHGVLSVEADQLLTRIERSAADNLDPSVYGLPSLRVRAAQMPRASTYERASFDVDLTAAYGAFISDLHRPADGSDFHFTDPDLAPFRPTPMQAIKMVASSTFPRRAIVDATQMSPFYYEYRDALTAYAHGDIRDPRLETALQINLERIRALPAQMGARFVLVDVTKERLWLYENGVAVDSMKVVVGTVNDQTPPIAALIRFAVFNPYWNVPPDLAMRRYAPQIAADLSALGRLGMDPWSDFSEAAHRLNPMEVNWSAAAAGRSQLWLRQRPGPSNAMGAVKFMFPNEFGVYLHDTPNRELFVADARASSAGCVRVEDYRRLARWLYRARYPAIAASNQRVDLPAPVPVYLIYLTAVPMAGRVDMREDTYAKDRTIKHALALRRATWPHR